MPRNFQKEIASVVLARMVARGVSKRWTTKLRRAAWDGDQVFRGLSIIPEDERHGGWSNSTDAIGWPFLLVNIRGSDTIDVDFDWLHWRDTVIDEFHHKKLPGVTEVYVCAVTYATIYLPRQFQENYDASAMRVTCWSERTRST